MAKGALRRSDEDFRTLAEAIPQMVWITQPDGLNIYFNRRWVDYTGLTLEESYGEGWSTPFHPEDRHRAEEAWRAATATGGTYELEVRLRRADGTYHWWLIRGVPLRDRDGQIAKWFGTCTDIEKIKQTEISLQQRTRLYATLSQVNQAIVRAKEPGELYRAMCDVVVEAGEFPLAWIGLLDEASGDVRPVAANGVDLAHWPFKPINLRKGVNRTGLVATALRSREVVTTEDVETDVRTRGARSQIQGRDFHSVGVVPFRAPGNTTGAMVLVSREHRFFAADSERSLLEEMGSDISFALEAMANETERNRAEEARAEQEQAYRELFDTSPIAISLVEVIPDAEGRPNNYRFLSVNPAYERYVGATAGEIIGRTVYEVAPQVDPAVVERFGRVAASGVPDHFEGFAQRLNRHFEATLYSPRQGQCVAIFVDTTERKLAEEARAQSEREYRAVFESSPVPMSLQEVVCDADGNPVDYRFLDVNPAFQGFMHTPADKLVGHTIVEVAPQVNRAFVERTGRVALTGVPDHFEGFSIGLGRYHETTVYSPRPGQCVTYVVDVTERRLAEQRLEAQAARLQVLSDASNAMVGSSQNEVDILGAVVGMVSEALGDLCRVRMLSDGGTRLDLAAIHSPDPDLTEAIRAVEGPSLDLATDLSPAAQVIRSGEPLLVPVIAPEANQARPTPAFVPLLERFPPHSFIMVPMRADEQVMGVLSLTRYRPSAPSFTEDDLVLIQQLADRAALAATNARLLHQVKEELTERAAAEEEVRALNETLEERVRRRTEALDAANRELEAFSYSVSHDLRAPLRHMDGFSRLLMSNHADQLDTEGQRLLGIIMSSARQMGLLIDDLLAFSRVARRDFDPQAVNVDLMVRSICDELQGDMPDRMIEFDIGPLHAVAGDPSLLKQVWANLLENAVKFTRPVEGARIEVRSECASGVCRYTVRDNGAGFDTTYADKLFQPFQRLHKASEFEGTGIGLAVVARIVQRHGGRVWAEGTPGGGATFGFSLPERWEAT